MNQSATNVFSLAERFWQDSDAPYSPYELMRYSCLLGFFAFSGHLFHYTVTGKVWNWWPFVQSLLSVSDGLMRASLQWILFALFPVLVSFLMQVPRRGKSDEKEWNSNLFLITYSMTPLALASLFVGVPFVERLTATLAISMFFYMLFYGYRIHQNRTIVASAGMTVMVAVLFVFIRQVFVYVIGF